MARNIISVDFQLDRCTCGMNGQHIEMLEYTVATGKRKDHPVMACMRLNWTWRGYQNNLKKDVFRSFKKCKNYPVMVFNPYDVGGLGREIRVYDVGGSNDCDYHWRKWYGVFEPPHADGPAQKLLAFVNVSRLGNFVVYNYPDAYRKFMPLGIMTRLHLGITERLLDKTDEDHKGLEFLLYGEFFNTKKSLLNWKKKLLFGPKKLKLISKKDFGACYEEISD
jgi:hypothetical protein